jgi:fused-like protein
VVTQVISIFYLPFANVVEPTLLDLIQQVMFNFELLRHILAGLKFASEEVLELPMGLLSRLVQGDEAFVRQYLDFGGLDPKTISTLLRETNPSGVLVDTILTISQLARVSKEFYENIHAANMYSSWKKLMVHRDPNVRSKMCNLIGNLCKHSSFFYDQLDR